MTTPSLDYHNAGDLGAVRAFVRDHALASGMSQARTELLMIAVNELATNTLQHTTGGGRASASVAAAATACW